ncbi:MAG TPA: protein-L-isoaspartate O-methyltransferase [Sphingomonadales bacterium]
MIDGQLKPNQVNDPRILDAFRVVPRELFVPSSLKGVAYVDEDIEVAPGRYLLEPLVLARMIQAANPTARDVALDIACGTGYSAALLAQLAGAVVAVEEDQELVDRATGTLLDLRYDSVVVVKSLLTQGWAEQAPYDVIVINGMVEDVPQALLDQLNENGRLVAVENMRGVGKAMLYIKEGGIIGRRELFDAASPLLPGFVKPRGFVF